MNRRRRLTTGGFKCGTGLKTRDVVPTSNRTKPPRVHREAADEYDCTVAHLDERHRVIICKDGIQWILQRRKKDWAGARWISNGYCATRKALTRLWHSKTGRILPDMQRLPPVLKRRAA